jgi:diguanylate cyclase (GGDEF)-like protein
MRMDTTNLSPIIWLVAFQFIVYAVGWGLFSLLLRDERAAVANWGGFMLLLGAAFLLAAQRGEPRTWAAYVGSNILWMSSYVLLSRGMAHFIRRPQRDLENLLLLGLASLGFVVAGPGADNGPWRVILAYGFGAVILGRAWFASLRPLLAELGPRMAWPLSTPGGLIVAVFALRTVQQVFDFGRVLEVHQISDTNRHMLFGFLFGAAMFNFSFMGLLTLRLVERLRDQAGRDPLTGLLNRRTFEEGFAAEWERLRRGGPGFAVLALDLDHFKRVNDTHGHLVGDMVLTQTAQRLRQVARQMDTLARTGGEEFVVLVPQTDRAGALAAAERLRRAVSAAPFDIPRGALPVTLSVGVALAKADEADPRAVLQRADQALYEAKAAGRDCSRAKEL